MSIGPDEDNEGDGDSEDEDVDERTFDTWGEDGRELLRSLEEDEVVEEYEERGEGDGDGEDEVVEEGEYVTEDRGELELGSAKNELGAVGGAGVTGRAGWPYTALYQLMKSFCIEELVFLINACRVSISDFTCCSLSQVSLYLASVKEWLQL